MGSRKGIPNKKQDIIRTYYQRLSDIKEWIIQGDSWGAKCYMNMKQQKWDGSSESKVSLD